MLHITKTKKQWIVTTIVALFVFSVAATALAVDFWQSPTGDPSNTNANRKGPITTSATHQSKGGTALTYSLLDIVSGFTANDILAWSSGNVARYLSVSNPFICSSASVLNQSNCNQPGFFGVWGGAKFVNYNPSAPLTDANQAKVLIGADLSTLPPAGLIVNLAGRHSNVTGAGRDAIFLMSDTPEDHSVIITNKPNFGFWSQLNQAYADIHFKAGLFDRGALTVNQSMVNPSSIFQSYQINTMLNFVANNSSDQTQILINKPSFFFYNYASSDPQYKGATILAKNVQLQDGTQKNGAALVSDANGLSHWSDLGVRNPSNAIKVVRTTNTSGRSVSAQCPNYYHVISGGGHCFNGSNRIRSNGPGPGLTGDSMTVPGDTMTYWYVECTANNDRATAYAICQPNDSYQVGNLAVVPKSGPQCWDHNATNYGGSLPCIYPPSWHDVLPGDTVVLGAAQSCDAWLMTLNQTVTDSNGVTKSYAQIYNHNPAVIRTLGSDGTIYNGQCAFSQTINYSTVIHWVNSGNGQVYDFPHCAPASVTAYPPTNGTQVTYQNGMNLTYGGNPANGYKPGNRCAGDPYHPDTLKTQIWY